MLRYEKPRLKRAGRADVDWVRKIGRGMSREIFGADVQVTPDPSHRSGLYVVLLQLRGADADLNARVRSELRLLACLSGTEPAFRVPECAGAYPVRGRLALVRRYAPGVEMDLRAGRQPGVRPWETLAEIMAALHGLGGDRFADLVP